MYIYIYRNLYKTSYTQRDDDLRSGKLRPETSRPSLNLQKSAPQKNKTHTHTKKKKKKKTQNREHLPVLQSHVYLRSFHEDALSTVIPEKLQVIWQENFHVG